MYINQINNFLSSYENITKDEFLKALQYSNNTNNSWLKREERDFLITLILIKFSEKYPDLILKWWTNLNKIYFPKLRLAENLSFSINTDFWQTARKKLLKEYETNFINDLALLWIQLKDQRNKYDSYNLAKFAFEYNSIIDDSAQTLYLEISLKYNLLWSAHKWEFYSPNIYNINRDTSNGKHFVKCMSLNETVAEKIRDALTKKTPLYHDFYDIWYIKNNSGFDFEDIDFNKILFIKLKQKDFKYTENYDEFKKYISSEIIVNNQNLDCNLDEIYEFLWKFKQKKWDN